MNFNFQSQQQKTRIEQRLSNRFQEIRAKRKHLTGIEAAKALYTESQEIEEVITTMMEFYPTIGNVPNTWL